MRGKGLRARRYRRTGQRLHLLHCCRRFHSDHGQAAGAGPAAGCHCYRDLRSGAAPATFEGIRLAGGAHPPPQPLLKAFDWPAVRTRATVDGVVTVVDALALSEGRVTIDEDAVAAQRVADGSLDHDDPIEEVFEDQLACADLVVLSKSDLVAPAMLAAIEARLKSVLRAGVSIVGSKGDLAPAVLIGLNSAAEEDMAARAGHHGEEPEHDHD